MLLPYRDRAFFNNTWTGDTHKETNVLPSARQDEDSGQQANFSTRDVRDDTTLIVEGIVGTRLTLIGEGLSRDDETRLQHGIVEV